MNRMARWTMLLTLPTLLVMPILAAGYGSSSGVGAEVIRPAPEPVVNQVAGLPDWTAGNVEALRGEIIDRLASWPSSDPELVGALGNFLGQALVRGIDVADLIDLQDPGVVTPELAQRVFDYIHYCENWRAGRIGSQGPLAASTDIEEFIAWHGGDPGTILALTEGMGSRATPSGEYTRTTFAVGMTHLAGATVLYDGSVSTYDNESINVPIGFGFKFYQGDDPTYRGSVRIGTNGYLTFSEAGGGALDGTDWSNDAITSSIDPDGFIAPWWDDMVVQIQGTTDRISYLLEGTFPYRVFTVEWYSISRDGGDTSDFHYYQAKLYELSGEIELHYDNTLWTADSLDSATIGMEDYTGTDGDCGPNCDATNATVPVDNYRFTPPAGDVLVIQSFAGIQGSVLQALTDLGYSYDLLQIFDTWSSIDFSPYDQVILALDGGAMTVADLETIRTDVIDQDKCAFFIGGTSGTTFSTGLNDYLVENTSLGAWLTCSSSPHLDIVDHSSDLANGLPDPHDFNNVSATYHFMDVTDPEAWVAAENCDGYGALFSKGYPGTSGQLVFYQPSPEQVYWSDPSDYAVLSQIIENGLGLCSDGPRRKSCSVLLLATDFESELAETEAALVATGLFGYGDIEIYSTITSPVPSIDDLEPYAAVLAWTNGLPADPVAYGDLLKDYVDGGGGLVLGTYVYSMTFGLSGGIMDPGYSPFLPAAAAPVTGVLDPASVSLPGHPFFQGVDLGNVSYWTNVNYVNPSLNTGCTLLAQDSLGNNLVAENPTGKVAAVEIFPSGLEDPLTTEDTHRMVANMLKRVGECEKEILLLSIPCASAEHFPTALDNLGLSYVFTDDVDEFAGRIGSGQDWSLVIVDNYAWLLTGESILDLTEHIDRGGSSILSYFATDSDLYPDHEATWISTYTTPLDLHHWAPAHPLLTVPNQVPPLVGPDNPCLFDGNKFDVTGGGVAVCGYSASPAPGEAAVIVGNSGRTVLLGEIIGLFTDDNDMDSKVDAVELAENAIVLVMPEPPPVPAAGPFGLALLALLLGGLLIRRRRSRG